MLVRAILVGSARNDQPGGVVTGVMRLEQQGKVSLESLHSQASSHA
jgi:hypothetical protein